MHHDGEGDAWPYNVLLLKHINRIPNPIIRLQLNNQKQNENLHALVVEKYQIDVPVVHLERDAVPGVEGQAVLPLIMQPFLLDSLLLLQMLKLLLPKLRLPGIVDDQLVDSHAHHVESGGEWTVNEAVYVLEFDGLGELV